MAIQHYAFALALVTLPAHAWEIGAAVGVSDTSNFCDQYDQTTCDRESDLAYQVSVSHGWEYLRGEVFFADLGSARVEDHVSPPDSATVSVAVLGVAVRPIVPVTDRLRVYGRLGYVRSFVGEHRLERVGFMFSSRGTGVTYGGGMDYRVTDRVSVGAQWARYDLDNRTELTVDSMMIAAGIAF